MTEKIDTQGMSTDFVDDGFSCTKTNKYERDTNGNIIYPTADIKPLTILTPELKKELKELINEVLDDREYHKRLNGPYDVYEYSLDELQE